MGFAAGPARLLRSFRTNERGITLIETIVALSLFALIAAALAGLLTSSINANSFARQKSLGEQIANDQSEWIRSHHYDDIGDGNPPGVINTSGLKNVAGQVTLRGLTATVTTAIAYVDDPTPTSYSSAANYKRITITVRRASDSKVLSQLVTYAAPPSRAPFGGLNSAIVVPTVEDWFHPDTAQKRMENVTVDLASTNPLVARTDTTNASGQITFAALTPNPSPTTYHTLTVTPPAGFVVLKEDDIVKTPTSPAARVSLSPGQNWPTLLRLYRPSTIYITLVDTQTSTAYGGSTSVTVTGGPHGPQTYTCPGTTATVYTCNSGLLTIWKIAGEPVVPDSYTVSASGGFVVNPTVLNVPSDYPNTLSTTEDVPGVLTGNLTVSVTTSGSPVSGAAVTVTGGPQSVNLSGTTGAGGTVSFTDVAAGSGYTVTAIKSGIGRSDPNVTVLAGTNTTVPIDLPIGSIPITVRWGATGPVVPNASVTVTGGPGSINQTLTTNASGQATVVDVEAGPGYNVSATKAGYVGGPVTATASTPGTNVDVLLPATGTIAVTVTRGGSPETSATVTITGGPDNKTYTGTTNGSGVANIVVPPTTAANPYSVTISKSGYSVPVAPVAAVSSGATVPVAVVLKTLTITVQRGGSTSSGANQAVSISATGGPYGTSGAAPAYTTSGTTNGSSLITMTLPAGTGTFTVKVWRTACGGSTNRSGSNTVSAAAGTTTLTVNMNLATCPFSPLP